VADNTDTCMIDGCTGVRASSGEQCLAHLAPEELEAALDQLTDSVVLRGVPISADLLRRILERLRDSNGHPRFAHADFTGCAFGEDVNFGEAEFDDKPLFDRATFANGASFTDVRFSNDASFDHAIFGERAEFIRTVFEGEAQFPNARFGWGTAFNEAQFLGRAQFADATFGTREPAPQNGVWFDDTRFADTADFTRATFHNGTSFDGATFNNGVFHDNNFSGGDGTGFNWIKGGISFNRATFHKGTDAYLEGASFQALSFAGVGLSRPPSKPTSTSRA
jgi:uncharacterized protein YjbI with pentapeptide repeats